jgi:hypothetical protein
MKKLLVIGTMLALVGCTTRLTDFTTISTKNVRLNMDKGQRVKGEDCAFFVPPNMKQAIDNAIQNAGAVHGDMLIDGVLLIKQWPFYACYIVEGNIVETKFARPVASLQPTDLQIPLASR